MVVHPLTTQFTPHHLVNWVHHEPRGVAIALLLQGLLNRDLTPRDQQCQVAARSTLARCRHHKVAAVGETGQRSFFQGSIRAHL